MKLKRQKIMLGIFMLLLWAGLGTGELYGADAQNTGTDVVYTLAELEAWYLSHLETGGTVHLGQVITIDRWVNRYRESEQQQPIVIDTGEYGFIFDGDYIHIGDYEVIGEGVLVPVIECRKVGVTALRPQGTCWNNFLNGVRITALGHREADGSLTGGTALYVPMATVESSSWGYEDEGHIRSYGTNAIGLKLGAVSNAICFNIEVEGENSTAIWGENGVNAYCCKLSANGVGAETIVAGGGIVMDTCQASSVPAGAEVVKREIVGIKSDRLYLPVEQGSAIRDSENYMMVVKYGYTFALRAIGAADIREEMLTVVWDDTAMKAIDTNVIGQTVITGNLNPPLQGLGLETHFPIELIIDVREKGFLSIDGLFFSKDEEVGDSVTFVFSGVREEENDDFILWRSDDNGQTWYDFSDSEAISWDCEWEDAGDERQYGYIDFLYREINNPICFQLEQNGKRGSNIIYLYTYDGKVYSGSGGDRDGSDRLISGGDHNTEGGDAKGDIGDNQPGIVLPPANGGGDSPDNTNEEQPVNIEAPETEAPESAEPATEEPKSEEDKGGTKPENKKDNSDNGDKKLIIPGEYIDPLTEANPESVTFIQAANKVIVPTKALQALKITSEQELEIEINEDDGTADFYLNGEEVSLPYSFEQTTAPEKVIHQRPGVPIAVPVAVVVSGAGLCGGWVSVRRFRLRGKQKIL